jgi:hypothetical protein
MAIGILYFLFVILSEGKKLCNEQRWKRTEVPSASSGQPLRFAQHDNGI